MDHEPRLCIQRQHAARGFSADRSLRHRRSRRDVATETGRRGVANRRGRGPNYSSVRGGVRYVSAVSATPLPATAVTSIRTLFQVTTSPTAAGRPSSASTRPLIVLSLIHI